MSDRTSRAHTRRARMHEPPLPSEFNIAKMKHARVAPALPRRSHDVFPLPGPSLINIDVGGEGADPDHYKSDNVALRDAPAVGNKCKTNKK